MCVYVCVIPYVASRAYKWANFGVVFVAFALVIRFYAGFAHFLGLGAPAVLTRLHWWLQIGFTF